MNLWEKQTGYNNLLDTIVISHDNTKIPVMGLELICPKNPVFISDTIDLSLNVQPNDASNKKIILKSSDKTVAIISGNNKLVALKSGKNTITALSEDGGFSQECRIEITSPATSTGSLTPDRFNVKCFPNPVTNLLHIETNEFAGGILQIFNTQGNSLYQQNIDNIDETLDLNTYPKGLYFVRLQKKDKQVSQKIIKLD